MFEDPLILHSPRVTIPKNNTKALKYGWPQPSKVSSVSENSWQEKVINLKDWCLKHNKKGLYVEGIHREEDILWNSNIIAERVSPYVVKTVTGRIYVLVGKMTSPVDSSFPRSFLKKFLNGFPPKWSKIYEEFLSESRIHSKDTERRSEDGGKEAKSEASDNFPFKNQKRNLFKTPDACPPSSSSTKMSRSGRVIKAPLEFWKGGRVTLDAQMNVTIHECYDKSI
uniref:SANTA domain-containing protein n=1 Tax=Tetraodon nigroviridis TaxID=99883 RepID=H3DIY0_TETNG